MLSGGFFNFIDKKLYKSIKVDAAPFKIQRELEPNKLDKRGIFTFRSRLCTFFMGFSLFIKVS
jgi:hypothetical protein